MGTWAALVPRGLTEVLQLCGRERRPWVSEAVWSPRGLRGLAERGENTSSGSAVWL